MKSWSTTLIRNPTPNMMRFTKNNKRISRKMPKKDIYHTSSSGRAANNTTNRRPIFRTNSQQVMTVWPRNYRQTSIYWTSTPIIQWLANPHQKDWHFLKRLIGTRTKMNITTISYGKTTSATSTARQGTQSPISEKNPKRLLIRSTMMKIW